MRVQDAAMREHRERLASAKQKARQLVRHQDVVLTERVDQVVHLLLSCQVRPGNLWCLGMGETQLSACMQATMYRRMVYP